MRSFIDKQGIRYSKQELIDIIESHEQWLKGDSSGKQADFSDCKFWCMSEEFFNERT